MNSISGKEDDWTTLPSRTRSSTQNLLLRMSWSWKLLRTMTYKFGDVAKVEGGGEEGESEGEVGI
ncbi:hypothetical protein C1H46_007489 [Malus baccata]|uniref:Uncharacterized protein n=1 Tax=Malus baccata TaxID=106549 RepID=A0A540N717_MALBA|nr:hypothetical protein C1H46_007489 [Malus baccata]